MDTLERIHLLLWRTFFSLVPVLCQTQLLCAVKLTVDGFLQISPSSFLPASAITPSLGIPPAERSCLSCRQPKGFTIARASSHTGEQRNDGWLEEGWGGDVMGRRCQHTRYISRETRLKRSSSSPGGWEMLCVTWFRMQWTFVLVFNLSFFQGQPRCITCSSSLSLSGHVPLNNPEEKNPFFLHT